MFCQRALAKECYSLAQLAQLREQELSQLAQQTSELEACVKDLASSIHSLEGKLQDAEHENKELHLQLDHVRYDGWNAS